MNSQKHLGTILVVEDEPSIADILQYNLEASGFNVTVAYNGADAISMVSTVSPDIILLDIMVSLVSGLDVCHYVRGNKETRNIPIIIISACGSKEDRMKGLNAGADDYIVKPFSPSEVVARVHAVLRRSNQHSSRERLIFGDVTLDVTTHRVTRNYLDIRLSPIEFRLLKFFMSAPEKVFSREQLLNEVWGRDVFVEPRTVDVHVRRLRKSLNQNNKPDIIRTVRSAGYALDNNNT